MNDFDKLMETGSIETVAQILGDKPQPPAARPAKLLPARHDDQPEFPTPGIYFGMDEDVYHSINAFSASGAKALSVSSMDWWASSVLNRDREDNETIFKALGRAYHCRVCEGSSIYALRYAIGLNQADYQDVLVSTDDIKAAIIEAGEIPLSSIPTGQMKPAPTKAEPERMKPVTRAAKKEDWIDQLLAISPDAQIWERMLADYAAQNQGKTFISAVQNRRIEIAAAMIERDPDLRQAFTGGYPEVAIFWYDEDTGCPMKAKLDYLKLQAIVDFKSFSNPFGRPISRAIDFTISGHKHYVAVVVYTEAVAAAKKMIRHAIAKDGTANAVVNYPEDMENSEAEAIAVWCEQFAKIPEQPTCLWVYQQTGPAPVTRGRVMQRGTIYTVTHGAVQSLKRRYVECTKVYDVDPWLDIAPIVETVDEEVPMAATDF